MANVAKVRAFFLISGLERQYFTLGQTTLQQMADTDEENPPDLDEAMVERFGEAFVDFISRQFAKRFSDGEIESLTSYFDRPEFKKLAAMDDELFSITQKYLATEVFRALGEMTHFHERITPGRASKPN